MIEQNEHARRSKASTSAMLDAATDLLREGGLAALTFVAIGRRTGFSRGLVTARFGSKAGLIEALIKRIVYDWQENTVQPMQVTGSGLERALLMLDGVKRQIECDDRHVRALYIICFEALSGDSVLQQRIADLHADLRNVVAACLRRGFADGSVRVGIDPELEATVLISALRGIGYQWMLDPERFDPVPALGHLMVSTADRLGTVEESAVETDRLRRYR